MPIDPISLALGGGQLGLGLYGAISGRKAAKKARKEQKRYITRALSQFDKLEKAYSPTGRYGMAAHKALRKQQARDIGAGIQQRLRAGLGGTTYGDVHGQYQATTGREERMKLEDLLFTRQADVARQRAEFLGGIQVAGPSAGQIEEGFASAAQGLGTMLSAFEPSNKQDVGVSRQPTPATIAERPSYLDLMRRKRLERAGQLLTTRMLTR